MPGAIPPLPEPLAALGHTSTGKPIHAAPPDHPAYAGFSPRDHQDAARAHRLEAAKAIVKQKDHQHHAQHATAAGDHATAQQHAHAAEVEGHKARQHDQFMRGHVGELQGGGDPTMGGGAGQQPGAQPGLPPGRPGVGPPGGGRQMRNPTPPAGPMGKSLTAWLQKSGAAPRIEEEPKTVAKSETRGRGLGEWFQKHQRDADYDGDELPGGEPGIGEKRRPQDGGDLDGAGRRNGRGDSDASEIGDVPSSKKQVLSDDDSEIDAERPDGEHDSDASEIGSTAPASAGPSRRDSEADGIGLENVAAEKPKRKDSDATEIGSPDPGDTVVFSRKSMIEEARARRDAIDYLNKSEDLILRGVAPSRAPAPPTIEKGREWTHGMVRYSTFGDEWMAGELQKSEGDFWAPFQAPTITYENGFQKSEACFMCKSQKPLMLSKCPHCGTSAPLEKSQGAVQVRGLSARRLRQREDNLYLPHGVKLTDD
jgi:hypothetical protein